MQTIMLPIEKPHLFKSGAVQRSGLLFYGPPGTGKTLLAKAIATECQMNFISVKGPEFLNMYVGESEKNVREVFERARENLPCIVFFDELDSLAPARGKGADSSQVMDRIVAQLLTEIDGLGKRPGMFTIGATNRPDLLDSALMRTGRFDKLIYLGVAKTIEEKVKILKAQTRKMDLDEDVCFDDIARKLPPNFTGADFSALTSESYMIAVKERIEQVRIEIEAYKSEHGLSHDTELLPETYFKMQYKENAAKQTVVVIRQ
jgi:peroxin-6